MSVGTFHLFRKRLAPQLEDLPTYALCIWSLLCMVEALGISRILYQMGKIIAACPMPERNDFSLLLHQPLHFYVLAIDALISVAGFAAMGGIFGRLSIESNQTLWRRFKGEKQTNWRARTIRQKYFPHLPSSKDRCV